jgi:cytochrome P450
MPMLDATIPLRARAPAPFPPERKLGRRDLIRASRLDAVAAWERVHFEQPLTVFHERLGNVLICSHPPLIRHVLVDHAANYPKDPMQQAILARGFGEALLTSADKDSQWERRLMAGIFTPRNISAFAETMRSKAERLVDRWLEKGIGRTTDLADEMAQLTFDILNEALFSHAIDGEAEILFDAMATYSAAQGGRAAEPAIRIAAARVDAIVARRKALMEKGADIPRDLLAQFLEARDPVTGFGLSEAAVRANVLLFMAAGHETTASALTWALYLLSETPEICGSVRAEADLAVASGLPAAQWLDAMPVTRAAIEETLRLYPSAPLLSRTALVAETVDGHELPRGARIIIAPWILHRHRLLWHSPDQFAPERFFPGRRETVDKFAYLPFGVGSRKCVGARFALHEMAIVLATIARATTLSYAGAKPPMPEQRINLRPKHGMPMRIDAR